MAETRVNVFDPSGKYGTIEESELEAALAQGFRLASEKEQRFEHLKDTADGAVGATAALTTSALNQITFGASDKLVEEFFPEQKEIIDAAREANPTASAIGTGGGFLAGATGLLAKGALAVGEKAAATVAAKGGSAVAQTAARIGAEGVVAAAPVAGVELLAGDPEEAAETLLFGGVTGVALGAGGKYALDKSQPLRTLLKTKAAGAEQGLVDAVDRASTFANAKAAGFTKGMIAKAGLERTKELADFAQEKGLVKLFSKADDTFQIVDELRAREGKTIGKLLRVVDKESDSLVDSATLLETIRNQIEIPQGELMKPERNAFRRAFNDIFEVVTEQVGIGDVSVRRLRGDVKLTELQRLKTSLGDYAYRDWSQVRPARELVARMERIVDQTIDDSLEKASSNLTAAWRTAKSDYRNYKDLLMPFKNQFATEVGNKLIGPSDMAAGIIGATQGGAKGALFGWILNEARQRYAAKAASTVLSGINRSLQSRDELITKRVSDFLKKAPKVPSGTRAKSISSGLEFFDSKRDKAEQIEELSQRLDSLAVSPDRLMNELSAATEDITEADAGVGAQLQSQSVRAIEYLRTHIPRNQSPSNPFEKSRFRPSSREVASFEKRLKAALDPYSVLDDLQKGKLARESVETLQAVYPYFHSRVSEELVSQASERKRELSFDERLRLSLLLGMPIEASARTENVTYYQSLYGQETQAERQGTGKDINIAENSLTTTQRIAAR